MALECRCPGTDLATIRQQLREVLPDTQITEFQSIAVARAEQRALVEARQKAILAEMQKNLELREQLLAEWRETAAQMEASRAKIERLIQTLAERVTPLVVAVSAIWLGLLSLSNVRQRRTEIGLLRALGKGPALIAWLFLGKAVVLGFLGGVFGLSAGIWLARWLGISALDVPVDLFALRYETFFGAVLGAPLISAVAGYLPMLVALRQDPASVLREA
jgi:ABC-type lipoprotein release transport system permease subunit